MGESEAVLAAVYSKGRATFGELLRETGLARSTLAKYLKEWHRRGVLSKEEDPDDARVVHYSLNDGGRAALYSRKATQFKREMEALGVKVEINVTFEGGWKRG